MIEILNEVYDSLKVLSNKGLNEKTSYSKWLKLIEAQKALVVTRFELNVDNGLSFKEYLSIFEKMFENYPCINIISTQIHID